MPNHKPRSARFSLTALALLSPYVLLGQSSYTISTVAGNGQAAASGDGGAALSAGVQPNGVAVDIAGNLYVVDIYNERIRKVAPNGTITTFAGTGGAGFTGDGGPAARATLNQPSRVAVDSVGNLYIADSENNRVRKVTTDGVIRTYAGNGGAGSTGDGGQAVNAAIDFVGDIALDAFGNLFIATNANVIRKVTPQGIISTVAGNGRAGFSGDGGPATSAVLNTPRGVVVDPMGNIYISDINNQRVRRISNGTIATVAGTGTAGYSGDGGPATSAKLFGPAGLSLDSSGNLYIADRDNNLLRVLLANGTIATVAGNGKAAFSGDGGLATSAALSSPRSVAVSGGRIYIADINNNRVRLLTPVLQSPSITTGGIISAGAFGGYTSVAPGSWIEIYGSNFASNTRGWGGLDFNGVNAPTALDGTSVTIGGQSAFVDFISPGQINALLPSNVPTGIQQVVVTNPAGKSSPFTINVNALQPGLLAPASFSVGGVQYAAALFADGTYVIPSGRIAGVPSRPAKLGDTIIFYGVGFGPVTPAVPAGQLVQLANTLVSTFQISIGGVPATASYAGLAPGYTGLYQFNVTVPNAAPGDFVPVTFSLNGLTGTQVLNIAVGN